LTACNSDAESYEFTKLDFEKDAAFIGQVWSWEGELDGKPFADGKVFK
jgi:elongation factor 1-gamma